MIVATSGSDFINYNRIISLSSLPYSVNSSLSITFRDPRSNSARIIRALYIIDLNNAVSLINYSGNTDFATINFMTLKISY